MKYFFQYVLGFKDRTNKKALMGTIVHRALQVLGDKKVAITNGKEKVENDDIRDLTLEECDDIDAITKLCFDHYLAHEKDVTLDKKELKTCTNWVYKALAYKNGQLDPRNQDIFATEQFFDIEIKKDWAKYDYEVNGEKISGYLSIKGTVDVIAKEGEKYFQVLDYKTGRRLNWATGEEKTYEDLQKDKQLLLYYYALKNLYPDWSFYVSIYYINDGGIFDLVFDESDYEKAEQILKEKFQDIKNNKVPRQLSKEQAHWKCQKLCKFSETFEDTGKNACQHFHDMIQSKGIDYVTEKYADISRITKYGDGGGRMAD
jgi:CRISPR/Cas system-associated exonuclease Cas4 (RecB family)